MSLSACAAVARRTRPPLHATPPRSKRAATGSIARVFEPNCRADLNKRLETRISELPLCQGFIAIILQTMSSSSDDDAVAHVSGTPAWQNAVQSLARSTALAG